MTEVVILGTGNVAYHLFKAFFGTPHLKVKQVYNHREESLNYFADFTRTTTKVAEILAADFYFVALKDDNIAEVTQKLNANSGMVLHTSGAVSIQVLQQFQNFGVFYPLQSFSKDKAVAFTEIPVCLEANSAENLEKIKSLAFKITKDVREISSQQRKALHLAAVFVNNFTNHLYQQGFEICARHQVDFSILKPLIKETAAKINTLAPLEAQTGPAVREDQKTIEAHLELLNRNQKNLYRFLTQSIQDLHGKKL